jgi:Ca2+-transporting ATPase
MVDVMREPMFMLLVAAGVIYLWLGDLREALALLASVIVIFAITVYQGRKTERALEALCGLAAPRATVIREGRTLSIPGREVVCGDCLLIKEGDRVSADAVLLDAHDLMIDESLLTGESMPVRKQKWDGAEQIQRPGGENQPFIFSGSLIVQGHGCAEVLRTGVDTEVGRIGKALMDLSTKSTRLQEETTYLVKYIAFIGLLLCSVVFFIYATVRNDWIGGLLAGITLAMSLLPEEFPVVLTVFLALGAWRISKVNVLTRHMPAIETLGETTVLCVDKTGTLTLNHMAVRELYIEDKHYVIDDSNNHIPKPFHHLIEIGCLAEFETLSLVKEYPLSAQLLAFSQVWQIKDETHLIASKGACETITELCNSPPHAFAAIQKQVNDMATRGLRVLAVAQAKYHGVNLPSQLQSYDFEFVGLIGFADPVKPTVKQSLRECYDAGVRVVMITGDYPITAQAIAKQIGLKNSDCVLTGAILERLTDRELKFQIDDVNIFARIVPEQKLRLVNAFKARNDIVAMTGDGVNDGPALKAAHIGIAMGGRGTDVAREAASLVIVDDDFSSIVKAIRMGRRIFDNIQNAMSYIVAVHIPSAGMTLLPLIFGWPVMLFPVHIVFLEFVIDPACSIAFEAEPEAPNIMQRPPRSSHQRLLDKPALLSSLMQGFTLLMTIAVLYGYALGQNMPENTSRSIAFSGIVLGNLVLILGNRTHTKHIFHQTKKLNPAMLIITGATLLALTLVLYVPYLSDIFKLSPLSPYHWGLCLFAVCIAIGIIEVVKWVTQDRSVKLVTS